ncbi:hypothetical protein CHARACLAT_023748 [Characodon lateralis]|uniref:Uncharacterized protein n=1 Tax=Characodon lateralis TaxID=208331 RepID=A0ABU7D0S9_9TELE|nr:hypothetical protein [Characodon lateralis]
MVHTPLPSVYKLSGFHCSWLVPLILFSQNFLLLWCESVCGPSTSVVLQPVNSSTFLSSMITFKIISPTVQALSF